MIYILGTRVASASRFCREADTHPTVPLPSQPTAERCLRLSSPGLVMVTSLPQRSFRKSIRIQEVKPAVVLMGLS